MICQLAGYIVHVSDMERSVEPWVKLLLAGEIKILTEKPI
jgi:hypothetical protein